MASGCHAGASFEGAVEEHTTHDLIGEEVVFGLLEELTGFRMDVESPKATGFDNAPVLQITRQPGFFARLFRR